MDEQKNVKEVQNKILDIMKYIDKLCRKNNITYFIMGGTALGAVRHGGFIPWDDDLDIFMTPDEYNKFKRVFEQENSDKFILQEWRTTPSYLEYAKVRMNGTTFIEKAYKNNKNMHQGIYVDIMMLHKVPDKKIVQKIVYYESKFVTLYALSQRNWSAKSNIQKIALKILKILPCKMLSKIFYRRIYLYDDLKTNFKYCYWITPAKFKNGLFDKSYFDEATDVIFEDTILMGSKRIEDYLTYRYGNYMKLPTLEEQKASVHALIFDVNNNYTKYLG